jgi:hypothetical protein
VAAAAGQAPKLALVAVADLLCQLQQQRRLRSLLQRWHLAVEGQDQDQLADISNLLTRSASPASPAWQAAACGRGRQPGCSMPAAASSPTAAAAARVALPAPAAPQPRSRSGSPVRALLAAAGMLQPGDLPALCPVSPSAMRLADMQQQRALRGGAATAQGRACGGGADISPLHDLLADIVPRRGVGGGAGGSPGGGWRAGPTAPHAEEGGRGGRPAWRAAGTAAAGPYQQPLTPGKLGRAAAAVAWTGASGG